MRLPKGRCPTHPGEYVKEDILDEMSLTQQSLADRLGVSRKTVNHIVKQKQGITASMALRLGLFTRTSPEMWLNLQSAYDLWNAERETNISDIEPMFEELEEG